ncbi:hypothetical protein KXV54_009353, partial [Aspergillus fumigatus]
EAIRDFTFVCAVYVMTELPFHHPTWSTLFIKTLVRVHHKACGSAAARANPLAMSQFSTPVLAVMIGHAVRFRDADEHSAIAKQPVTGPVRVGFLGLEGDEQADRKHHGGPDKAIHHYAFDHYPAWAADLGDHPLLAAPG